MPLSWNEIKSRALAFSRTWADATDENSQAKPFWLAFFEVFGITDKRVATFELAVKKHGGEPFAPTRRQAPPPEGAPATLGRPGGGWGFVDRFWPGDTKNSTPPWTKPTRPAVAKKTTKTTPSAWRFCLSCPSG